MEVLAERHGGRLRRRPRMPALTDEVRVEGRRLALAFPQTYMNGSGEAVQRLLARYGIDDLARLVVIHDELDLPTGRVQIRVGGGLAGHNGLRSIRDHLRATSFVRVRIGIGRPPSPEAGADYVLSRPPAREREALGVRRRPGRGGGRGDRRRRCGRGHEQIQCPLRSAGP